MTVKHCLTKSPKEADFQIHQAMLLMYRFHSINCYTCCDESKTTNTYNSTGTTVKIQRTTQKMLLCRMLICCLKVQIFF